MRRDFDLIMFDLDGTLIETAPEIFDAVNDTLHHFDLPLVTQPQVEVVQSVVDCIENFGRCLNECAVQIKHDQIEVASHPLNPCASIVRQDNVMV